MTTDQRITKLARELWRGALMRDWGATGGEPSSDADLSDWIAAIRTHKKTEQ